MSVQTAWSGPVRLRPLTGTSRHQRLATSEGRSWRPPGPATERGTRPSASATGLEALQREETLPTVRACPDSARQVPERHRARTDPAVIPKAP